MIKIFLILLFIPYLHADTSSFNFFNKNWKISKNVFKALKRDHVIVDSQVDNQSKLNTQSFSMKAMAYHPKKCSKVIQKLAKFEHYPDMIDFIKDVSYDEKFHLLKVRADHILLPFPMIVHIIMKRPTTEGVYDFIFPTGLFQSLKGTFEIREKDKRCAVFAKSYWSGKHTKIPNFAIELFSETLTKIAVKTLIRKTSL